MFNFFRKPEVYKEREGRIKFDGNPKCSKAVCTYCDRDITQEETSIAYVSHGAGSVGVMGSVWCNKCKTYYVFSNCEHGDHLDNSNGQLSDMAYARREFKKLWKKKGKPLNLVNAGD